MHCSCDREFLSKAHIHLILAIAHILCLIVVGIPVFSICNLIYIYTANSCLLEKTDCIIEKYISFIILFIYFAIIVIWFSMKAIKCSKSSSNKINQEI